MKIAHDIHTHNVYSKCCKDKSASTLAYIEKEADLGMKVFGLSNHIWDENVKGISGWYKNQTILLCEEAKPLLKNPPRDITCLFGAETEYFACQDQLGMSVEGAKHFDYLIIPHTHLHMRNEVMWDYPEVREMRSEIAAKIAESNPYLTEKALASITKSLGESVLMEYIPEMKTNIGEYTIGAAFDNYHALFENPVFLEICKTVPTSISHPFGLCGVHNSLKNEYLALRPDSDYEECFKKAKALGVSIEINTDSVAACGLDLTQNQLMRIFAIAKGVGCKFTFGSDSHSIAGLEKIFIANDVIEYLKLDRSHLAELIKTAVVD